MGHKEQLSWKLPQRFCGARWFNENTAEKAILSWPDIVALIKHFSASCSSKKKTKEQQII